MLTARLSTTVGDLTRSASTKIQDMARVSLEKLAKLAKLEVVQDVHGKSVTVKLPTLAADDIDRTGNINIWRLQKMMTMARLAGYHVPNSKSGKTFLEYNTFTEKFYTFLGSMKTEVSREFYDLPSCDEWPGVKINFHLGYIGGASLNTVATLRNALTNEELAWNTNTVVCVDKATRKPAIIPDWWKQKYEDAIVGNKKLQIAQFPVPDETFDYQVKVAWCDVDTYKHVNYLAYIRYCLDAAMDAIVNEHFTHFGGDIFGHHVRKMEVLYIGESVGGDIINVSVWQDANDSNTLYFSMRRGEKKLFQCLMQFFPTDS